MADQKTIEELEEKLLDAQFRYEETIEELQALFGPGSKLSQEEKEKVQAQIKKSNVELGYDVGDDPPKTDSGPEPDPDEEDLGCLFYQHALDFSSLDPGSFAIITKPPTLDAFGRSVPSSKLYTKADASEFVFLNPINLSDCRAIVQVDSAINVNSLGLSYISDPALTVISNVAIEDLAILNRLGFMQESEEAAEKAEKDQENEEGTEKKQEPTPEPSSEQSQPSEQPNQDPEGDTGATETPTPTPTPTPTGEKPTDEDIIDVSFYIDYLKQYIMPPIDFNRLAVKGATNTKSVSHDVISPRKATPMFIGIPIKSNNRVYGPWTNNPSSVLSTNLTNNLFGNIKVEQNSDYVPWNYGNMYALEQVIQWGIAYDVNYQSILETGRLSIAGPPIFGIGGSFNPNITGNSNNLIFDNSFYALSSRVAAFFDANLGTTLRYAVLLLTSSNDYGFPVISNISIQTSEAGIKTSYSFQTYNPKTGLFNKELVDRSRALNDRISKLSKEINQLSSKLSTKNLLDRLSAIDKARSDRDPYSVATRSSRFYGTSPVELIISQAQQHLHIPHKTETFNSQDIGEKSLNISDYSAPSGFHTTVHHSIRHHHWAGIIVGDEIGSELLDDYDVKAAMSLDGLLSPVSFYPTRNNSTYNLSTLVTGSGTFFGSAEELSGLFCPKCNNERFVFIRARDGKKLDQPIKIPCNVCCKAKIDVLKQDRGASSLPDINIYSLNPIVVPSGEFRNPYSMDDDIGRHSILSVARGSTPPTNAKNFLLHENFRKEPINSDYHVYDLAHAATTNQKILNNQRFMALRGPLMLHGWGFDKDGYPVPNQNDMPYSINDLGLLLRFQLVVASGDKNFGKNDLSKPGLYVPLLSNPLGDVITQQYEWKGTDTGIEKGSGRWTKKATRSKKFHLNWAQRQDLWPVGPVDLRWDSERRVWDASGGCKEEILPPFIVTNQSDINTLTEFLDNRTVNKCPYKMVYITLEQDMIKEDNFESTHPARGFIDDIEYSKEPLQNNYRRLVYVIDTAGYTAPRGAKLLCRYNRDSGFYEPITKPILTALGSISNGQARIEMSYVQGRRSTIIPTYVTKFNNPLNIVVKDKGLFNYINGSWTLIATG